jgi:DNA-binding PadR family transcriptional regulator
MSMRGQHTQLFILGLLSQGEAHGYQICSRAREWGVEKWAGFGTGSIYNALRSLEKHGLISQTGVAHHGAYVAATVYEITSQGRAQLPGMISSVALDVGLHDPFDLATAFFGLLPVDERRALLQARMAKLEEMVEFVEESYIKAESDQVQYGDADWALATMEKATAMIRVALDACRQLIERCESWPPPGPLGRR